MDKKKVAIAMVILGAFAAGGCTTAEKATIDAQPKIQASDTVRVMAMVEAVDKENRILTLRNQSGELRTMVVNPQVKNFDRIQRGDRIVAEYLEEVAVYIEAPGVVAKDERASVIANAGNEGKPSGAAVETVQRRATVEAIDYQSRVVALREQNGNLRTITVSPRLGPLEKINRGDNIVVRFTQTVAIGITKTTP